MFVPLLLKFRTDNSVISDIIIILIVLCDNYQR